MQSLVSASLPADPASASLPAARPTMCIDLIASYYSIVCELVSAAAMLQILAKLSMNIETELKCLPPVPIFEIQPDEIFAWP